MSKRAEDMDDAGSGTSKLSSARKRSRRSAADDAPVATAGTTTVDLDHTTEGPDDQADVIVAEIAETRIEMDGTLSALGDRLDPKMLISEVQDRAVETAAVVQERAVEAASTVMGQARDTLSEAQERAVETASTVMGQAQETMVVTATTVMDQARDTVHDATVGRIEEMVDTATTAAQDTGNAVVRLIKENPVPAGMAGIGLWMLWQKHSAQRGNGGSSPSRAYAASPSSYGTAPGYAGYPSASAYGASDHGGSSLGDLAGGAQQGLGDMAGRVQDTAGAAVGSVQDAAATVGGTVQDVVGSAASTVQQAAGGAAGVAQQTAGAVVDGAGQAVDRVGTVAGDVLTDVRLRMMRAQEVAGRTMQQNPLALGATAVAVGAAVGLALPSTRKEQELLGGARDAALEKVAETVEQASPKVEKAISGKGSDSLQ